MCFNFSTLTNWPNFINNAKKQEEKNISLSMKLKVSLKHKNCLNTSCLGKTVLYGGLNASLLVSWICFFWSFIVIFFYAKITNTVALRILFLVDCNLPENKFELDGNFS